MTDSLFWNENSHFEVIIKKSPHLNTPRSRGNTAKVKIRNSEDQRTEEQTVIDLKLVDGSQKGNTFLMTGSRFQPGTKSCSRDKTLLSKRMPSPANHKINTGNCATNMVKMQTDCKGHMPLSQSKKQILNGFKDMCLCSLVFNSNTRNESRTEKPRFRNHRSRKGRKIIQPVLQLNRNNSPSLVVNTQEVNGRCELDTLENSAFDTPFSDRSVTFAVVTDVLRKEGITQSSIRHQMAFLRHTYPRFHP